VFRPIIGGIELTDWDQSVVELDLVAIFFFELEPNRVDSPRDAVPGVGVDDYLCLLLLVVIVIIFVVIFILLFMIVRLLRFLRLGTFRLFRFLLRNIFLGSLRLVRRLRLGLLIVVRFLARWLLRGWRRCTCAGTRTCSTSPWTSTTNGSATRSP
jgi:hypothetical protein